MKVTSTNSRELNLIRALVHGDSGIGKTTSLATLPRGRTVVAAAERGLLPLRRAAFDAVVIEGWEDIRDLVRAFSHPLEVGKKSIIVRLGEGEDIRDVEASVLAIDSLSELSRLCKKQIVEVDRKAVIRSRTKGKSDTPESIYDEQMTQEDWGIYGTRMSNMISAICHLPLHVIFTSLSNEKDDKKTGMIIRRPNLQGAIAVDCPAFFDFVFHMEVGKIGEEETRVWRTVTDGSIMAKDATGMLEPFEPADWTQLMKKVLAAPPEERTEPAQAEILEAVAK